MNHTDLEKSKVYRNVETIDYVPNSVVDRTILKKITGSISIMSFDKGEELIQKISPFDVFVQILEGNAEINIEGNSFFLETGQFIIIPAHKPNFVKANERFKMIATIIKSGYE